MDLILSRYFVSGKKSGTWYAVSDPKIVGERVVLQNDHATEMIVIAKKISEEGSLVSTPQQSDYTVLWDKFAGENEGVVRTSFLHKQYRKLVPKYLRDKLWEFRHKRNSSNLGRYYKGHFKKLL